MSKPGKSRDRRTSAGGTARGILGMAREALLGLKGIEPLLGEPVAVRARPLKPEEAIGKPGRDDFPLVKGRERMMEATLCNARGHAFTDQFGDFDGTLAGILDLGLGNNFERAVFVATLNAAARLLGVAERTVHCRDEEPALCAQTLPEYLESHYPGRRCIAFVGFQPAMVQALAESGRFAVTALDLDPENVGKERWGVPILDSARFTKNVILWSDIVMATGTSVVNGTADEITTVAGRRPLIFYGVTISGVAALLGLERFCPYGH